MPPRSGGGRRGANPSPRPVSGNRVLMASRTNRLPRWLKILPGVILLGALLVAAGAALFLRASLPRLDG
ncbi:hypothetical protein, partial [Burkholderia pseudomallei]